ncbi:MAG: tripartite tricarboxylate transporter substrate binding protein, partial [Acidovorax sp.]
AAIVKKLNTAVREVLELPDVRARFEANGNTVRIETPEQFRQTVHTDRNKWAQVVKDAKISID